MADTTEYLRAGEIAQHTGLSVRTVRRWISEQTLPSVKLGGARLVPRQALERLLSPPAPDREVRKEEGE